MLDLQSDPSKSNFTQKCAMHPDIPFTFYCFDDKTFLCNKCFKLHRSHKIEIREDIEMLAKYFQQSKVSTSNRDKMFLRLKNYENDLLKLLEEVTRQQQQVQASMMKFEKEMQSAPPNPRVSLLELSYEEFSRIAIVPNLMSMVEELELRLERMLLNVNPLQEEKSYWESKKVDVVEHSKFLASYDESIMLGRSEGSYSLFEGNANHFCVFDFKKNVFLSRVKIKVYNFQCTLKNFTVKVKNSKGEFEMVGRYQRSSFEVNGDFEFFNINCEGRYFRFDFLDAWGLGGGDYILIKSIEFEIMDM